MGNYPQTGYDYSRKGLMMVTLRTAEGVRLAAISEKLFLPNGLCRVVQDQFKRLHDRYPAIKIGQYQVMPDHVHFMVHVVENLPAGAHVLAILDDFRTDCRTAAQSQGLLRQGQDLFTGPINHTLIFNNEQKEREVAYIRDNVRRYRLKKLHPNLFALAAPLRHSAIPAALKLSRYGNGFLLDKPIRVFVQTHREVSAPEAARLHRAALHWIARGAVFVSPFISKMERAIKDLAIEHGSSLIQLIDVEMTARWKPGGKNFDLCAEGRLMIISAFEELGANTWDHISRERCLRLNQIGEIIANERL